MLMYPFNHECEWRGPYYIWGSNQIDAAPPKDCQPVYACRICGAQQPAVLPSRDDIRDSERT